MKTTVVLFSKNRLALAGVCLSALMFGLEISSVPVILPTLEKVLHGNFKEMQWIMNAYTIACTTVLMATGTLADRYGRKLIFIISVVLFGIASLLCGIAHNVSIMIAARFMQGMSGGAMLVCQIAILSHQFREGKARAKAFGLWGIVFGTGLGFGPLIGGSIVTVASWQWVFLIHVFIAIITLLLIVWGVQEVKTIYNNKLDVVGMLMLTLTVLFLTYFITQGSDTGFTQPVSLISLFSSVGCFVIFIITEKKVAYPMFDFSVFRIRNFSGAILGSVGMNISFWPFMIYLPMYFQGALGYSSSMTGLSLLAYSLPTLLFPPLGERLSLRFQPKIVIPLGLFTIGLGFILMWWGSRMPQASWLTMLPGLLVAGIGLGLTNTPVTNTSTASVHQSKAGMASGIDISARMITLAINIALMGFMLVEGISSYLRPLITQSHNGLSLRELAEKIAGEGSKGVSQLHVLKPAVIHAALTYGFGMVMLYGCIGVWVLSIASFITFRVRKTSYLVE
ncbi:MAG TPA: MFS transporter [Niastella sp.]